MTQPVCKSLIWKNGPSPWEIQTFQGQVEVKIGNGSGIRDPQLEIMQVGIMRADRRRSRGKKGTLAKQKGTQQQGGDVYGYGLRRGDQITRGATMGIHRAALSVGRAWAPSLSYLWRWFDVVQEDLKIYHDRVDHA